MTTEVSPLIAIFGPTAVGKTDVAVTLAQLLAEQGVGCTAVSADAYQLYRGLEVLSGAPGEAAQRKLRHLFVASHDLSEEMSAGRYAREAHDAIDELSAAGTLPIVVGGAGLYMQAALTELEMRPALSAEQEREARMKFSGLDTVQLRLLLEETQPEAAAEIVENDRYRLERALALSDAGVDAQAGASFWEAPLRRPALLFGLTMERQALYVRIGERVDRMIAAGAAEEVAHASNASSTARKVIGFEEVPAGEMEAMKRRTRRYAKRQLTWMRRIPNLEIIDVSDTGTEGAARLIARAWRERAE